LRAASPSFHCLAPTVASIPCLSAPTSICPSNAHHSLKTGISPSIPARRDIDISTHPPSRPSEGAYFGCRMKPRKNPFMDQFALALHCSLASLAWRLRPMSQSPGECFSTSQHVKFPHLMFSQVLLLPPRQQQNIRVLNYPQNSRL
jgi:hypothetical protein